MQKYRAGGRKVNHIEHIGRARPYPSLRSAVIGSTRVARRAGR